MSTAALWAEPAWMPRSSAESVAGTTCRFSDRRKVDSPLVVTVFQILLALTSTLLVVMILLHKGRGGGLSDMFGGGSSSSLGGSSVAEKNLDRITIGVALIWVACIIALGLLMKTS